MYFEADQGVYKWRSFAGEEFAMDDQLTEENSSLVEPLVVSLDQLRVVLIESFEALVMLDKVTRAMEFAADEMEKQCGPLQSNAEQHTG
jgi:hypothetical protein